MVHKKKLKRLYHKIAFQRKNALVVALIFAGIGAFVLGGSYANNLATSVEPESGNGQNTTTVTDSSASGGAAIKFGGGVLDIAWQSLDVVNWGTNVSPAAWNPVTYQVLYNKRGANNMWNGYAANPDGTGERCLTCTTPNFGGSVGVNGHRGISDVSSNGQYMLVTVESAHNTFIYPIGADVAEPGKGTFNDVWLYKADGTQAWRLSDYVGEGLIGTIWPRFDSTGNRLIWSEMTGNIDFSHLLGSWRIKVATITWSGGVPSLSNIGIYKPDTDGRFYEPYGFSPDGSKILFSSDYSMPTGADSQIWTANSNLQSPPVRLSPPDAPTGLFSNYNEFAFWTPDGKRIIYARTRNTENASMDYWSIKPDGTDNKRLTHMGLGWHSHGEGRGTAIAGGMAFDPRNPNRLFVGIAGDSDSENINAVMINLNAGNGGLKGDYFSDPNLQTFVTSRTENPSSGFNFTDPPASGMQLADFSARWSGKVTIQQAGSYQFCMYLDDGGRLWINNQPVIDSWYMFPGSVCGTVSLSVGQQDIRLEYRNGGGDGRMQLTWHKPGDSGKSIIPGSLLRP